jgi:hypothetical protein
MTYEIFLAFNYRHVVDGDLDYWDGCAWLVVSVSVTKEFLNG